MNRLTDRRRFPVLQCRCINFRTHTVQVLRHGFEVLDECSGDTAPSRVLHCLSLPPSPALAISGPSFSNVSAMPEPAPRKTPASNVLVVGGSAAVQTLSRH